MKGRQLLNIGPPHRSMAGGMNTSIRRQQLPPSSHYLLRNVRLFGEAWTKRPGNWKMGAGARTQFSISTDAEHPDNHIEIPYTMNSSNITQYNLGTEFTIFVSFRTDSLATDVMVAGQSDDGAPPWRILHNTDGTISAVVKDTAGTSTTVATSTFDTKLGVERTVALVRNGASVSLYVNEADPVTSSVLGATLDTAVSTESIFLGGWTGRASGSLVTYYELRIFRKAYTDDDFRVMQYPWTGKWGDPNMVLHLTFENGSGSTITDHSRIGNTGVTANGAWTWAAASPRLLATPVTGIHMQVQPDGRRVLLADVKENHYRVKLN